ncbi:DUF2336 domain-containing protein [Roseospira visakhapatnamensis]|uniref:Uncharacterized protein (DUF2336 family) n=1 Tax=Roseospira visakhapatnamensis TaxID=390880 RepID=A0A7W6RDY3_9PROT|nr:DUF2336 domain-containing protein [Roseospira visakhapatnamensis]MBB4266784.1 uncharacterized protein (DUF2336 family) [Roseospira visakhapatnamensis]
MTDLLRRLVGEANAPPLSYAEARALAADPDPAVRRTLARRTDLVPEVLYFLAEDQDPEVRRAIADNVSTPLKAFLLLTQDSDVDVRLTLVQRIAALAPGLSDDERTRVRHIVDEVLTHLAQDQIPRVRALLSEALKHVVGAPAAVIKRLARDVEVAVATPVLTFSPVLNDTDLLEIIRVRPVSAKLSAIARRAGLNTPVTDAIAATDDALAITDMLANQGAQIREETLDTLITRATQHPEWHNPLVHRPRLHREAARRLALFVSDTLVRALILRRDLDPEAAVAVADAVRRRLGDDGLTGALLDHGPNWRDTLRDVHDHVVNRIKDGGDPIALLDAAMAAGDRIETTALIGAMAGISPFAVAATVKAASIKGVVSMAWKAGLDAAQAVTLQRWLANIPPNEVLLPDDAGEFRLGPPEMDWQVEMFCETEARANPWSD